LVKSIPAETWGFAPFKPHFYRAIVADPPWKFRTRAPANKNPSSRRGADRHYPTMSMLELEALPVRDLAHPDGCHLFMWTTGPHLQAAIALMNTWGFRYSGVAFTWAKLKRSHDPMQLRILPSADGDFHVGLGLTTRKNCEFVLLGRRGNCRRHGRDVRELIVAPVREHSRKPEEFRVRVDRYTGKSAGLDIPTLELFARSAFPGWDAWGNETGKFNA
jgi:N6-adenosine-specific RNA methylase IME4